MRTACAIIVLGLFGWAQSNGPHLSGRVLDAAGRPVHDAVVSLREPASPQPVFTLSDSEGAYSFGRLKTGADYELHADSGGLASAVRTVRFASAGEVALIELPVSPRIRFEEIGEKAGLAFSLRNGGKGRSYQPEIMLGGVAAFDYNNDGCIDIFATNGATLPGLLKTGPEYSNRLFRNNCDMTFTDVTETSGLSGSGYSIGAGAGDFDNDGFTDLAVTSVAGVMLYRNLGNGKFEDVTARAGLSASRMWSISAGWVDYDNDGLLDLFVTNYVAWRPELDTCTLARTPYYCHPRVYDALPNQLFHNNGNGTFTDVSAQSGIAASRGKGMGLAFGDFNGDGRPDVFVGNDSMPNLLFENLGGGKFREVAVAAGVAYAAHGNAIAGMGADFRDIDNDGLDDISLDAMYFDTFPLYKNGGKHAFTDITETSGIAQATHNLTGWGMGMFDFDNDGNKDLFFAASHFPGSNAYIHEPAEARNRVLRNLGNGSFEDVSSFAGKGFQQTALFHGAAFADFDGDGRVDAVVSAVNGSLRLFRNISPQTGHWIALRLKGTRSNRQGLGARVRLTLPVGNSMYNRATSAVGYASSSESLVRFGLGPYDTAASIEIHWPAGGVQTLRNVKANQVIDVAEP